ncbi:MAG: hypothetical protein ABL925_11035 [Methylococcales bacterium]
MKKLLLITLSALLLPACSDKNQFSQAVLEQMQQEQDVKDYKIEPEAMANCVVNTTEKGMPGFFVFDPYRLSAYRNYTKMLTLAKSPDPKKTLAELNVEFGSGKKMAEAHSNYTESILECLDAVMPQHPGDAEKEQKNKLF